MTTYYIPESRLSDLASGSGGESTFIPHPTNRLAWLDTAGGEPADLSGLRQPRAAQSPKGVLFPPAESLGSYGASSGAAAALDVGKCVIVGMRACELRARNYLDKVMLSGQFADPAYGKRREATVVVSTDCVDCTESCFCNLVGGKPFCEEGYDVNLTPVEGGFLADVATDAGKEWVGDAGDLQEASPDMLAKRDEIRSKMVERLEAQNAEFDISATDAASPTLPLDADESWQKFAADCVECGACTHICPTCYCFYLYDQSLGAEQFERLRTWDSCLFSTYHRMAGGEHMKLSPRPRLLSRLANRVLHKFTYSLQQYELLGCVGCGRCVDACLGAIDIRQVASELGK